MLPVEDSLRIVAEVHSKLMIWEVREEDSECLHVAPGPALVCHKTMNQWSLLVTPNDNNQQYVTIYKIFFHLVDQRSWEMLSGCFLQQNVCYS